MTRTDVIQSIIDRKNARHYLEIGVADGSNFHPIRVRHKTAVDPCFRFNMRNRIKWMLKNRCNARARYHELPSDDYFENTSREPGKFDVVFIDGLHTYQQSLRDVIHALDRLADSGVIVMHDCNPSHAAEAWPAESFDDALRQNPPGWNGEWCGDVWKTICNLRSLRSDLDVFVLNCDRGLGIVTRGRPESRLDLTEEEIGKLNYDDLAADRSDLLNLKDEDLFAGFLSQLQRNDARE